MSINADNWSEEVFDAFLPEFGTAVKYSNRSTDKAIAWTLGSRRQAELFSLDENYEGSVSVKDATFPRDIETGGEVTVGRTVYRVLGTSVDALKSVLRIDYGERYAT